MMKRTIAVCVAIVAFVSAASCLMPGQSTGAATTPNILFILVDDMGYADAGVYGSERIQTPHLDRFAADGIMFTQAYAGNTVCAPSRSTLLTGTHMGRTPVRSNTGGVSLRPGDVTIAELLKAAGYATGGFGKWGLAEVGEPGVPEQKGFDEFFGYFPDVFPDTG